MRLSIIIPTLNEITALRHHLPALLEHHDDVWISDGGSHDGSVELAHRLGAKVVQGKPQRGEQLNRGAQRAEGDVLLFLHADTHLPANASQLIAQQLDQGCLGGGFRLRFDEDRPILRLASRLINQRSRWTGCPLGDQGQFVRREVFDDLEGYRPWPILEDLDFARRLKRQGRTVLIQEPVVTSARRYLEQGIARQLLTNWLIFSLYLVGVSPQRLAGLYRRQAGRPMDDNTNL